MPVQYRYCFICAWEDPSSPHQWYFDNNVATDQAKATSRATHLAQIKPGTEIHLLRTTEVYFVEPTAKKAVVQNITVPAPTK